LSDDAHELVSGATSFVSVKPTCPVVSTSTVLEVTGELTPPPESVKEFGMFPSAAVSRIFTSNSIQ
jgi:hypothetical protein